MVGCKLEWDNVDLVTEDSWFGSRQKQYIFLQHVMDSSKTHSTSYSVGTGWQFLWGQSDRSVKMTICLDVIKLSREATNI
jgi:hypothetical protein